MRISGDSKWNFPENSDVILIDGEGYELFHDRTEVKLPVGKIGHIKKKIALHVKEGCIVYLLVYYVKPK
jgi:hypothetical protein